MSKVVNLNVFGTTEEENNAFLKAKIVELEEKLAQVLMHLKLKSANTYINASCPADNHKSSSSTLCINTAHALLVKLFEGDHYFIRREVCYV